jgi:hypothetical protein
MAPHSRFNPDFVLVEIAPQHVDHAGTIGGEPNIGIRSEQIERVLGETSLLMLWSPCENMEGWIVFLAPCRQL